MLIDGEKWACESCVKGHRVSTCNHSDRPLTHIAKKGRPVKQCDHCRDARKSKSHHAKCDCGSKRAKDKTPKNETKSEESGCCCHKGENCLCGNKSEALDLRLESSLHRPTLPVMSKPLPDSDSSELATPISASNHHHKPSHRINKYAQNSGVPYKIPRPNSLHGAAGLTLSGHKSRKSRSGSLISGTVTPNVSSDDSQTQTPDHQAIPDTDSSIFGFSSNFVSSKSRASQANTVSNSSSESANAALKPLDLSWLDTNLSYSGAPSGYLTSPTFGCQTGFDWNEPTSAALDYFSPADLPLSAHPHFPGYVQPISNSGESGFQSAPGLTISNASARSEAAFPIDNEPSFWPTSTTSQQMNTADQIDCGVALNDFSWAMPGANGQTALQMHQNFNIDSGAAKHAHRLSDSTTVPERPALSFDELAAQYGNDVNTAIFDFPPTRNADMSHDFIDERHASITIPAGSDDGMNDGWFFPTNAATNSDQPRQQYGWLQDAVQ